MRVKLKFLRAALRALAVIFFTQSKKRFFSSSQKKHSELVKNENLKINNKIKWNEENEDYY